MPRSFDIALALMTLIALSPLLAGIAIAIFLVTGESPLYRQERVGRGGAPFTILKFRTLDHQGRATALGRILRRCSFDELPQFWNVVRGDMALVGPRPLIEAHQPLDPGIRRDRQALTPGITGCAQVRGRNLLCFDQTYRLDLWYARRRCVALDLYILALTLPAVATGRGACPRRVRRPTIPLSSPRRVEVP